MDLAALVIVHLAATWVMVGVIWFVQLVHYPMFDLQPSTDFARFAREHQRRTTWVVVPPMLVELGSALFLLGLAWLSDEQGPPLHLAVAGVALLAAVWISTFAVQVPRHSRLLAGKDSRIIQSLILSNWLRTVLWSARGLIAVALL